MHRANQQKNGNRKWLIIYLLIQTTVFCLFAGIIDFNLIEIDHLFSKFKNPQGFILLTSAVLIIVFEGILKNEIKEFLVFWRVKNRLPGHRAFSHIGPNDARIDMTRLALLFPNGFPNDAKKQNNEWYHLYRNLRGKPQVFDSHKAFLITRDLTSLTAVFILFAILGHFFLGTAPQMGAYNIILLLVMFGLMSLSSRNYAERFVANVLVEASIGQTGVVAKSQQMKYKRPAIPWQ